MVIQEQINTQEKQALEQRCQKAEADAAAKMQLLATMAHEIRTPMTAILGYADMLAESHHSSEFHQETAQIIRNNVLFLLQLVNNTLDFSKMEADKLTFAMQPLDLPPLFADIYALFSNQAKEKLIDFEIKSVTPFPETIDTDPVRIKQILINLVGNAIKFTDGGTVALKVSWNAEKNMLRFDISDTGIGIPPEQIDSLFLPFEQGNMSTIRKYGGTGLGLAITKQLVQMLGGELSVQSEPKTGSTFTVVLPISISTETKMFDNFNLSVQEYQEPAKEIPVEPKPVAKEPLKDMHILLAEDDQDCCRLFALILEIAGARVDIAFDGGAAFDFVLQNENDAKEWERNKVYDAILMDMQMPEVDGYTATRKIRQRGCTIPIIALTANAMQEERQKCLAAGCDDYASKPILRDELIAKVLTNVKQ